MGAKICNELHDYLPSNETFHSYAITFLRLVDYSTEFFFSQRFVAIQRLNLLLLCNNVNRLTLSRFVDYLTFSSYVESLISYGFG